MSRRAEGQASLDLVRIVRRAAGADDGGAEACCTFIELDDVEEELESV
jgi:hypothetical protein